MEHARLPSLPKRCAGILLPVAALPGPMARGDFDGAVAFLDFLVKAGVRVWQVLPMGPTHGDFSPYLSLSAHAGNPDYIGLRQLYHEGLIDCEPHQREPGYLSRQEALQQAFTCFQTFAQPEWQRDYQNFLQRSRGWLEDYALFMALREHHSQLSWFHWPQPLRDRDHVALNIAKQQLAPVLKRIEFEQFLFFRQWRQIVELAREKGIILFGDMPLFVSHDSADVWAHREYFMLDEEGEPTVVAGVPPDCFSATGQRWGNPLYNWPRLQEDNFDWWIERLRTQSWLYDMVRIDHFRGLQAYWEIPAAAESAETGRWVEAPGAALLQALTQALPELVLVAEDLGIITPAVTDLRQQFSLPGMNVLQFAFDSDAQNPHMPENLLQDCVLYTGTHDNDTSLAWYQQLPLETRERVSAYLTPFDGEMPWRFIACALASKASLVVVPLQDWLGLGEGNRTNTPGTTEGNWCWRFRWQQLTDELTYRIHALHKWYNRT